MDGHDPALVPLTEEIAREVLTQLAPGLEPASFEEMRGSFSNSTWLVSGSNGDGVGTRLVVRRYRGGWSDQGGRARLEFHALELCSAAGAPVAEPIHLDGTGELLGTPGIVVSYIDGTQLVRRGDREWTRELAKALADIHSVPCSGDPVLLDADHEALYFTHTGDLIDDMKRDRDGQRVWDAVMRNKDGLRPVEPTLVHLDFWTGNVLWRDGRVVGIVDWEEASRGDPAIDLAYLRRDLWGLGMRDEADDLVREYESASGRKLENLPFWELTAAVRPMPMANPESGAAEQRAIGIADRTADDLIQAHRDFIEYALKRAG